MTEIKKKRKVRTPKAAKQLLEPLQFIAAAQHEDGGAPYESHCRIADGWVTATDGVLTIGHKFEGDLVARPHTLKLIAALKRCGPKLSITKLENDKLSIKSELIKAKVACLPEDEDAFAVEPDKNEAEINDTLKEAFRLAGTFVKDSGDEVLTSSIIVRSNSCVGTNRHVIVEYWHGIDLPTMMLPKRSAQAILKVDKKLTGFGYSGSSATFYFEDESWIRTQLYDAKPPAILDEVLNVQSLPREVPDNFFEALEAIQPFSGEDIVYFEDNKVRSNDAEYVVEGMESGVSFSIEYLRKLEKMAEKIDYNETNFMFFGSMVRGVVCAKFPGKS